MQTSPPSAKAFSAKNKKIGPSCCPGTVRAPALMMTSVCAPEPRAGTPAVRTHRHASRASLLHAAYGAGRRTGRYDTGETTERMREPFDVEGVAKSRIRGRDPIY